MSNVVECLKERGLVDAITNEALIQCLEGPTRLYCGFDPTADSLHIGSLVGIVVLRWFQKFGHTPVIVLGGATGRIGDPSGKSVERPLLESTTIAYNVTCIRRHFETILDFFHPKARAMIFNNDEWLAGYPVIDFLRDIGKYFRLSGMLSKESVRTRLHSEEGMSFTEFSYQLLQAYDFFRLYTHQNVILQIGGSDQWGNITEGIELIRKLTGGGQAFGLTFPLLTRSDGKKFGKTEEGAIWLSADRCSPYEFYQYFVRVPDADVIKMMRMLTFMDLAEIHEYELKMKEKDHVPNTTQRRLAEEVTRLVHGEEGLVKALKVTQSAAPGSDAELNAESFRTILKDMPNQEVPLVEILGQKYIELAVKVGLLSSKGEAVRLIQNGGAYLNNQRVHDPNLLLSEESLIEGEFLLLASGKKKKILVKVQK